MAPDGDGVATTSALSGSLTVQVIIVLLDALMVANLVVGLFNLLPGLPLDGGVLLRAALWKLTGRSFTATIAAAWIGSLGTICAYVRV
jgi:Zn-dependent protease